KRVGTSRGHRSSRRTGRLPVAMYGPCLLGVAWVEYSGSGSSPLMLQLSCMEMLSTRWAVLHGAGGCRLHFFFLNQPQRKVNHSLGFLVKGVLLHGDTTT